jgi:transcriptional regulator with PAS, ATPase and Fis domain
VRVLAATHKDLYTAAQEGAFREDLYYRVAALTVHVPPLRERPEDIGALISHFLSHYARRNERAVAGITADAIGVLQSYAWPGNVRELAAEIERLVLYTDEGCYITTENISARVRPAETQPEACTSTGQVPAHLENMLEDYERRVVTETLRRNDYNVARAAQALGLGSRQTLYKKLKRLSINVGDFLQDEQQHGLQLRADRI